MPPRDLKLCPALRRANPADSTPITAYRRPRRLAMAQFGDGALHPVTVRALWRDRHGRWVIQLAWSAGDGTWGECYLYDPKRIRPAP